MKADGRISVKDYRRNKNRKLQSDPVPFASVRSRSAQSKKCRHLRSSQPAFVQSRQRPVVFGDKLLDDAAAFQFRRQHFPGVGFHF